MIELPLNIVNAACDGDEDAYAEIVNTLQVPVYNLCYRMLYNDGEAEEAAQESFWRAWSAIEKYDRARPFSTWIMSIAAHYCIDRKRKKQVDKVEITEEMEELLPDSTPNPEHEVVRLEREAQVHRILSGLNEVDRAMVIMAYWNEMSMKDIAEAVNMTESAVKSRLFRIRKQVAEKWID